MIDADADTAMLLLAAASRVIDGVQDGMRRRGFTDVRPAHGFAFVRIAAGEATTIDVAAHLGVTKQAASQLVDELVAKGYVERRPHPSDARARLVVLTDRGWACTRAADRAAERAVRPWIATLGATRFRALCTDLLRVAPPGPIRPPW